MRRAGAAFIDQLFITGNLIFFNILLLILSGFIALPLLPIGFIGMYIICSLFYFTLMESRYFNGQTIGCRAFGIKVVTVSNELAGLSQTYLRYLGGFISLLVLGLGYIPWGREKRNLTDLISDTKVVFTKDEE